MFYLAFYLWRTCCLIRAIIRCFSFITYQFAATFWTMRNKMYFFTYQQSTRIHFYTCNLRNNFTAFFYIDHISHVQVQTGYDISVVQGSSFHHRSRKLNGIQIGYRSNSPCSTDLISHLV
ncbi:hypothetical protein EVA_07520 [gut metagenome]|uniref:Uncharacterized protein n=1 Tax=gut metagenome TaxID=749906 RepID=J9CVW5_9ZZZZ